jgi:secreted trypsin-like serine protease
MRSAILAFALLPSLAAAEAFPLPAADPAQSSPFAFAQSGQKAARAAEAGEAGSKVVGGEEAPEGAWPWQVALMINGAPLSPEGQFCGGTMVLDTWVLTAAHCIHMAGEGGTFADLPPQAISVLVGTNALAPGKGDLVPAAAIFRHPDYVGTAYDFDIALIRLARRPNADYATIKVPDAEFGDYLDQPGVVTTVTGWGLTEGGAHPETMRQAQIQMMDRDLCNAALLEARAEEAGRAFGHAVTVFGLNDDDAYDLWDQLMAKAPPPMSENFLCSGTFEGGKTACSGDSGGPLVVALDDGSYIQAGVVSWGLSGAEGKGCNERAPFSAYTRVSNFLPWLDATIRANP